MRKLAVLGPGLLGGSIALAARKLGWQVALWARREAAVAELRERRIAELASNVVAEVVDGAELVIFCVPIGAMAGLAAEVKKFTAPTAVVTDVGSVKGSVVEALGPIFAGSAQFVGSHPMAGSEQTGIAAARSDLFQNRVCIVTPTEDSPAAAVSYLDKFWRTLGCAVRFLSPEEHDETVALVSHLPHLVAAALAKTVGEGSRAALAFAGPGFRDTTRVAGGAPDMWTEILRTNRGAVQKWAQAMIENLQESIRLLDLPHPGGDHQMNEFLAQAKAERDRLRLPLNDDGMED